MRYLIVSENGQSLGLARRLESEGHAVLMHIVEPRSQRRGTGLVSIVKTPRPIMDSEGVYNLSAIEWLMSTARPDITIFDGASTHEMASRMQSAGYRILGTNSDVKDRALWALRAGTNSVEAYFNGAKFVDPFVLTAPYYHLFNENIGPVISSMGAVAYFTDHLHPTAERAIKTVEPELRATSYRGPVTMYLDTDGGIQDFDCGFSEHSILLFEALSGSLSQFFVDVINGTDAGHSTLEAHAIAVKVTLPPFPYMQACRDARYAMPIQTIEGLDDGKLKHFWPHDLQLSNDVWSTTGDTNEIGFFTARGESIREAQRRVYRTIKNMHTVGLQYRTDIGSLIKGGTYVLSNQ